MENLDQLATKLDDEADRCDEAASNAVDFEHRDRLRREARIKRMQAVEARAGLNPFRQWEDQ